CGRRSNGRCRRIARGGEARREEGGGPDAVSGRLQHGAGARRSMGRTPMLNETAFGGELSRFQPDRLPPTMAFPALSAPSAPALARPMAAERGLWNGHHEACRDGHTPRFFRRGGVSSGFGRRAEQGAECTRRSGGVLRGWTLRTGARRPRSVRQGLVLDAPG